MSNHDQYLLQSRDIVDDLLYVLAELNLLGSDLDWVVQFTYYSDIYPYCMRRLDD